jgi:sec-independent protein translocase protein TatB
VRSGWDNVRAEVERELEIEEIKRAAREAAAQAEAVQNQLRDGVQQVHQPLAGMMDDARAMVSPETPAAVDGEQPGDDPSSRMQGELPLDQPAPAEPHRGPAA